MIRDFAPHTMVQGRCGAAAHWPLTLLALIAPAVPIFAQRGQVMAVAVLGLAALALWLAARGPFRPLHPLPARAVAAAVVLWSAVSALWALDMALALRQTLQFAGGLLAFVLVMPVARGLDAAAARRVGLALAAGVVLAALLLAVDTWAGWPVQKLVQGGPVRPGSHLDNKALVTLSLLAWPAALALVRQGGVAAALALMAVATAAIVPGESGTAVMALTAGAIGAVAALAGRRATLAVLGGLLVAGALIQPWLAQLLVDHGLAVAPEVPGSWRHRLFIWSFAADLIAQKPLFGWGAEAARVMPNFGIDNPFEPGFPIIPMHTHNGLIQVWLELGILGLGLVLALLLLALAKALRMGRTGRVFAVGAWSTTIAAGLSGYGSGQSWWLFTIVLQVVMLTAAMRIAAPAPAGGRPAAQPNLEY